VSRPERPELLEIPKDNLIESIKALTTNMGRLVKHIERLEIFDDLKTLYWE
jgi:hypothetical protein